MKVKIGPKSAGLVPGWWCEVTIDGQTCSVGVLVIEGEGVRPDVWGVVRQGTTKVWEDRVPPGIGPREILALAGLLTAH